MPNAAQGTRAPNARSPRLKIIGMVLAYSLGGTLFVVLLTRAVPWADELANFLAALIPTRWDAAEEIMTCPGNWKGGFWIALDCKNGPSAALLAGVARGPQPADPAVTVFGSLHPTEAYECRGVVTSS